MEKEDSRGRWWTQEKEEMIRRKDAKIQVTDSNKEKLTEIEPEN